MSNHPTLAIRTISRHSSTLLFAVMISVGTLLGVAASPALAERLESNSYVIQFGNFNVTSGEKDSASYKVTDSVGQTFAGFLDGTSYDVGAGFQYIYTINSFRFTISKVAVDLGVLTAGAHNTASHNLTISTRGAGGYTIYAYELHPLRHQNGSTTIPDTTCDAGTCTHTTAGVWTNQNVAGFGYNMTGNDIVSAFTDSTYFKQFADSSAAETMQAVMTSANIADNRQSTVTYKAGIPGSQAAGNYQTGIVFVAVPGY